MSRIWKYCYWLKPDIFSALQTLMTSRSISMLPAKQNPCEVIRADIGYAAPEVWPLICKHDATPWYRVSRHAGKYLVASSFPLDREFEPCLLMTPATKHGNPRDGVLFHMKWARLLSTGLQKCLVPPMSHSRTCYELGPPSMQISLHLHFEQISRSTMRHTQLHHRFVSAAGAWSSLTS